jgi:hypothetical protein
MNGYAPNVLVIFAGVAQTCQIVAEAGRKICDLAVVTIVLRRRASGAASPDEVKHTPGYIRSQEFWFALV